MEAVRAMSTAGRLPKLFAPHGQFDAYVDGRIVISEVTGPWNKELIDEWALAVYPLAKTVSADGPHAGIAIIHGSLLCPPDALEELRKAVLYSAQHLDNVGHAIVADASVEGRNLLARTFAELYTGVVPYRMFDALLPAKEWINTLLDECLAKRKTGAPPEQTL